MQAFEANFDGLVGPTHNYAGLSFGNVASRNNEKSVANPKAAAKQGLRKMKQLADLGFHQGVLPPLERPSLKLLRELGFTGTDASVIERAAREAPELLAAASSASAMWTANAATVSPSADTSDERVHFTPANLASKLHRAIEHGETRRSLSAIFADEARFRIHHALPGTPALGDEGAANHTRFCREYGAKGVEFFVYGRSEYGAGPQPKRFPARQTLEASRAVARVAWTERALDRVRAAASRRDRRGRFSQRRDRGRQSHDACSAISARSSTSRRSTTNCARSSARKARSSPRSKCRRTR